MDDVVAPLLHRYVPPPVPVMVAEAPAQMMPSLGVVPELSVTVVPATGSGLTVMVAVAVAGQLVLVTVKVYVVVIAGVTTIEVEVSPVLQRYEPLPEPIRVAEAPIQMIPSLLVVPELSVTEMAGVGSGLTLMVCVAVAEQLLALVTVTV